MGSRDKLALKAIAGAYGIFNEEIKKRYSKTGDLGDVTFELDRREGKSLTMKERRKK
ncbi:hypothetical protein [Methanosarcina sp. UBA5]|uniref:hypothetical protein n=1 Tax=Methanosarcina sp. UBA5 TaxID=1915593 RepID=UPI0032E48895